MLSFLDRIPFTFFIAICASLGLAPFFPVPHVWEKLMMLMDGTLTRPIDIFDFFMHGIPFVLLVLKILRTITKKEQVVTD